MRCADAQNLASSHASLPDWRGLQGNKLMRETNQDFAAWIESEKMAEKKIKIVSASFYKNKDSSTTTFQIQRLLGVLSVYKCISGLVNESLWV